MWLHNKKAHALIEVKLEILEYFTEHKRFVSAINIDHKLIGLCVILQGLIIKNIVFVDIFGKEGFNVLLGDGFVTAAVEINFQDACGLTKVIAGADDTGILTLP